MYVTVSHHGNIELVPAMLFTLQEFMHDIETHTEDYLVLVPEGRDLMERYTPSDWLGGVMGKLKDRWFGYVDALSER